MNITVKNVRITFRPIEQHGRQEGIVFELPANATSAMIQTYLDQCIVPYLPFGNKSTYDNDLIGINDNAITDIQLTFDGIETDQDKFHVYDHNMKPVEFEPIFGSEYNKNIKPIMVKQLEFTVSFSQFVLKNIGQDDTNSTKTIKILINKQIMHYIESNKNPKLNLHIQNIECGDVNTIDEGYANDRLLSVSRISPVMGTGCEYIHLPKFIEVSNDNQYCFIVRSAQKKTIDLYFYTEKDLIKKRDLISSDFDLGRNTFNRILRLGSGETTTFKYGVAIKCK